MTVGRSTGLPPITDTSRWVHATRTTRAARDGSSGSLRTDEITTSKRYVVPFVADDATTLGNADARRDRTRSEGVPCHRPTSRSRPPRGSGPATSRGAVRTPAFVHWLRSPARAPVWASSRSRRTSYRRPSQTSTPASRSPNSRSCSAPPVRDDDAAPPPRPGLGRPAGDAVHQQGRAGRVGDHGTAAPALRTRDAARGIRNPVHGERGTSTGRAREPADRPTAGPRPRGRRTGLLRPALPVFAHRTRGGRRAREIDVQRDATPGGGEDRRAVLEDVDSATIESIGSRDGTRHLRGPHLASAYLRSLPRDRAGQESLAESPRAPLDRTRERTGEHVRWRSRPPGIGGAEQTGAERITA